MAGHSAAAGRCRHGGAARAVLAAAGSRQLQRAAHRGRGRQLRRGDGQRGGGVPNAVWADGGRCRRAQHMEQAEGGRAGGGQQDRGRQRRARAVHDHHAGGQQRYRRAGRAILPAAAGGLLQRCAARGRGRQIRRGHHAGCQGVAVPRRTDGGRHRRASDVPKPVRRRAGTRIQRPRCAHGQPARARRRAAPRRHRRGGAAAESAAALFESVDTGNQLYGQRHARQYL